MKETRLKADLTPVAEDVFLLSVPIPSPLRQVNCYLIRGAAGWTIVDTGFNIPATQAAWQAAFNQLDMTAAHVEQIIVTHHHPDHYGAAGWLQQLTGAPVLMSVTEAEQAAKMWHHPRFVAELVAYFRRHGGPAAKAAAIEPIAVETLEQVLPGPEITTFEAGTRLSVGNRRCETLVAPGHSPGLLLLWDAADGLLFANDMILDPISPNISVDPFSGPNPLADYMQSLSMVEQLPARLTLPGHRSPITDLARRCRELKEHHVDRLGFCRRLVREQQEAAAGPVQAWPVALGMFGDVMDNDEASMFALGETVAHLEYLVHQGDLVKETRGAGDGEQIFYRLAPR